MAKPIYEWQILDHIPITPNVKSFGAVGDGVTDDTAAINAAIATLDDGDTLFFPAGCYIVKAPAPGTYAILPLDNKNITVCGDGIGLSTIKVADACPTYSVLLGAGWADVTGLEVCDLTFDHNIFNNPITNNAEIMAYHQTTIYVRNGSDLHIHDLEVINASSVQNICLCPRINANILIEDVTATGIGDDPNHVDHDASFFYTEADNVVIRNCDISCATLGLGGGRTGVETHGSDTEVTNITITNFKKGMNICDPVVAMAHTGTNILIHDNTFNNTYIGVDIWSNNDGIDGIEINNNVVNIPVRMAGDTIARSGVQTNLTNAKGINALNCHDNSITVGAVETTGDYTTPTYSAGILIYGSVGLPVLSNSQIANNNITNFGTSAIRFYSHNINTVTVSGNVFTNCGCTTAAASPTYVTPIVIYTPTVNTLTVSGNTFVDNLATKRITYCTRMLGITTSAGIVFSGNTYNLGTLNGAFSQHFSFVDDVPQPLITETITGFVPPDHKVDPASVVIDGITTWTVDGTGLIWTQV